MQDAPILLLTGTIWAYWIGVGIMVMWVLRKTHKSLAKISMDSDSCQS